MRTNRGYKLASHQWVERGQVVRLESIDECSVLCGETRIQVPISREQAERVKKFVFKFLFLKEETHLMLHSHQEGVDFEVVHVSPISVFFGDQTVTIRASKNLTRKKAIEEACKKDGNLTADDWICHPGLNEEEECTPGDMFVVIRIKKNEMNEDS